VCVPPASIVARCTDTRSSVTACAEAARSVERDMVRYTAANKRMVREPKDRSYVPSGACS
jgi:hypothetical protein